MPRKKCDHEYRVAWAGQWRKCTKCSRTEWFWNCQGRWRRAVTDEHLMNAPSLDLSKSTFVARSIQRSEQKKYSRWNPITRNYEDLTFIEQQQLYRDRDGRGAHTGIKTMRRS